MLKWLKTNMEIDIKTNHKMVNSLPILNKEMTFRCDKTAPFAFLEQMTMLLCKWASMQKTRTTLSPRYEGIKIHLLAQSIQV